MEFPTDVLVQFLHSLAAECDSDAQRAWHHLAFLTCKRDALVRAAKIMPRPILLRIEIESEDTAERIFWLPFFQATVVCIDVDWGDGCVEKLREKGHGYAQHTYAAPGEYNVRIFPAPSNPTGSGLGEKNASLDHLGFESVVEPMHVIRWSQPLREIVSLGNCGLRSLSYLFSHCGVLKVNLQNLRVNEIRDMKGMFSYCKFNQPIGDWDVSNVTDMSYMFCCASEFNQPIGDWNVGNVTDMGSMFSCADNFDQPIGRWNVGKVTTMSNMFCYAREFNQPIGDWNVGKVVNMRHMFFSASLFNQPIGDWDVSQVFSMESMFNGASLFNQPISKWNTQHVCQMHNMFNDASAFNQPIGEWNVSTVTNMMHMFASALSFNQPIGAWDVSSVSQMGYMFSNAQAFNQPLEGWNVAPDVNTMSMFSGAFSFNQRPSWLKR
jgi:surface protein